MGTWLNATTYYSKSTATNFSSLASWGTNADGSGTAPATINVNDNYNIVNGAAVILNANLTIGALNITLGSLTASANTLTIGNLANSLLAVNGGTLNLSGTGSIVINGQFIMSSGAFNQTGGTMSIDGNNGTLAQSVSTFMFSITGGNPNCSAGSITIVDPMHASILLPTNSAGCVNISLSDGTNYFSGTHTFILGNGVSTQAGWANGFTVETYQAGLAPIQNLTVNGGNTSTRWASGSPFDDILYGCQIKGNLTINAGSEFRNIATNFKGLLAVGGNIINNGILTISANNNASALNLGTNDAFTVSASQTISGTGVFRNLTASPTANFNNIIINNPYGISITSTSALTGTGTGTVSGRLTFTDGEVNLNGSTFTLGISATSVGTLNHTAGGFSNGSMKRWFLTTTIPSTLSNTIPVFPFVQGNAKRHIFLAKSANLTTAGSMTATHTNTSGLSNVSFLDGAYTVNKRTNASWTITTGNGLNAGAVTFSLGLYGEGPVVVTSLTNAPRLVQVSAAIATHVAPAGAVNSPIAKRSGLTIANLTSAAFYHGVNSADLGLYSVNTGDWNDPTIWSTGVVPTSTQSPLISSGTTVTVSSNATCATVAVSGILTSTGGTLSVVGASATGVTVAAGGRLNVSGGIVNVGPTDNTTNNRRVVVTGTLNVSSGTLFIAGNMKFVLGSTYAQSGGTIKIDGTGTTSSTPASVLAILLFEQAPTGFAVTGGTLVFVDPSAANTFNTLNYNYLEGSAVWGPGHTTKFGDGVSTTTGSDIGFYVDPWVDFAYLHMGNVIVSGGGTNRFLSHNYTDFPITGDFTVNAGAEAQITALWVAGNVINNGTLVTYSSLNMALFHYTNGTTAATSAQSIGGSGLFANSDFASTANLYSFYIRNSSASGVTMNVPLTMNGELTMYQGKLNTTSTNILSMYSGTGSVFFGTSTAGWINGPMKRIVPANTTINSFSAPMPVGKTSLNQLTVIPSTSAGGDVTFTAETFDSNAGTVGTSIVSLNANRRWSLNAEGGIVTSYAIQGYDAAMVGGNALVGSSTAAGTYDIVGNGSVLNPASVPLTQYLSMSTNELNPVFPLSFGFGQTGPLNVQSILTSQVTGGIQKSSIPAASTAAALQRFTIVTTGSSGTINMTNVKWTYTGTAEADILNVSLWAGSLTSPTGTAIATTTISGGAATFGSLTQSITFGQNTFWIQVSTSSGASLGDLVDGYIAIGDITFDVAGGATATGSFPVANLDPAGNRFIDYCAPTYTSGGTAENITNVTLVGTTVTLNNSSTGNPAPYYTFYNSVNIPDIQQGGSYSVNVTQGTDGSQFSRVWIDFNRDGLFAAGESFSTNTNAGSSGTSVISVTVPIGAILGNTRMRVRGGSDNNVLAANACGAANAVDGFGEAEDYIVNITAVTPKFLSSITATETTLSLVPGAIDENLLRVNITSGGSQGGLELNSLKFTYTGTAASDIAASGVKLWTGTSSGPVAQIGSAQSLSGGFCTFSGLTSTITSGANYYWITVNVAAGALVDNVVDGEIAIGDIVISNTGIAVAAGSQPTALLNPAGSRLIDYCLATQSFNGANDYINSVALNGQSINLLNTSGYNATTNNYTYFNSLNKPDLYQGGSYTLTLTFGSDASQYSGVWIDFNKDAVFASSEYFSAGTNAGASGTSNITISIPSLTFLGDVRMRVRGGDDDPMTNTLACGDNSSGFGETEDYIVTLNTPPGCSANLGLLPATATATATNVSVCIGGSSTLNITTPTTLPFLAGITYQWVSDVAIGGAYATVVATTATPLYTFSPGSTKYYRCRVLCNGTYAGLTSSPILVTLNTPVITASTGATRCGQGAVSLSATGPGTISWFDSPTGAPLATGPTYSPIVSASTTFYAASRVGGVTEPVGRNTTSGADGATNIIGYGIQFNVLQEITMNSVVVYPNGTGNINIALFNSGGIEIASTGTIPITGTGASTPVAVPLGFNVQVGNGYTLRTKALNVNLIRDFSGSTYPYNSASGAVSVTSGYTTGASSANYFFYEMSVSTGCIGDKVPVSVTVTPPTPLVMIPGSATSVCSGVSKNISVLSADLGYTYTWDNGLGSGASKSIAPTTNGTYVVTAVNSVTGCNLTGSIAVTVNALPSAPVVTSSFPSYCPVVVDQPSLLTAVSFLPNQILSESFESGVSSWTFTNTSTGPDAQTIADQAWKIQTSPYEYSVYGPFSSGAAGNKFLMSNSDASGSSSYTTTTVALSPVFAIPAGSTSATLSFKHYYSWYQAGDVARVQISTNGGTTWANLSSNFNAAGVDIGAVNAFQSQTFSLATYVGQTNLRLRFRYVANWAYFWAVDDIVVSAVSPTNSFSFSPEGGLFNDLATTSQYVANNVQTAVYAAPFTTTTYNVSVVNPVTNCISAPSTTTVTVCSAVTDIICGAAIVSSNDSPPVSTAAIPTYNSIGTSTGGQAGACQAFTNDAWYKVLVPASGDIHVYTFENGSSLLDLSKTMITIFSSSDGTCTGTLTQVACDNGSGQGDHSYASAAGLTPGLYAYVRISTPTTSPTPAGKFKMWVMSGLYWTSTSNANWFDPSNWYGGDVSTPSIVPDQNKTIIIPNNVGNIYPVISGTSAICAGVSFKMGSFANIPGINIPSGAEFKIQSKLGSKKAFIRNIGIYTNSLIPRISGNGTLRFNEGGNNQAEILNKVSFKGVVAVRNGVTVAGNGNMRFDNNSVLLSGGVAPLVPSQNYSGTVTGNIVYVRSGSLYGGFNYWSSPIASANTDLLLSNYGNNIYQYNNQNPGSTTNTLLGWSSITTGTTSIPGSGITMTPGKGYIQTFAGNGTVTFTGTPNQSIVSIPTTVNGSNNFNLLGNPYPAALSYDAFKASNAALGSVYLWSNVGATQPYTSNSYVVMSSLGLAGNSVAGFTAKEIGPAQGFLTNVSSAGSINFAPSHVVPTYPGNSPQFLESNPFSLIRLRLTNSNQISFDALVGFGETGSEGVDFGFDSPRMPSSDILEVYSLIEDQQYTTQFLPNLTSTRIVDLGTVMSEAGNHTFDLVGFENFDSSVRVYLEDVLTGEFHNMNINGQYSFANDPSFTSTRFRLHFMAPIAVSATGTCLGENNGKMIISNPNNQNPISATLRNEQGVVVGSSSPFVGEHVFQNIPSGSYAVDISLTPNDLVTQYVNVDGGGIFSPATFIASASEVSIADAIVEFSAEPQGATLFTWNFGDGVTLSGTSTPVHAYTQPGVYTVTLTTSNGGCESTASSIITVTNISTGITEVSGNNGFTIYPNPANESANLLLNCDIKDSEVTISITDATGRIVNKHNVNNLRSGSIVALDINELANGVYEVTLDCKNFHNFGRLTIAK